MNRNVSISKIDNLSDDMCQDGYWVIAQSQPQMAENFYHTAKRDVACGHLLYVACTPRMLVGVLMGHVFVADGKKYGRIEYNFVDKKYRNHGIGGKMLEAYELYAKNHCGVSCVYLKSTSGALSFYIRHGYVVTNGCYVSKVLGR